MDVTHGLLGDEAGAYLPNESLERGEETDSIVQSVQPSSCSETTRGSATTDTSIEGSSDEAGVVLSGGTQDLSSEGVHTQLGTTRTHLPDSSLQVSREGEMPGHLPSNPSPPRTTGKRGVTAIASIIPSGEEVGRKARVLRESMFDSMGKDDVAEVMAAILAKAKTGDVKAATLFFSLIGQKGV